MSYITVWPRSNTTLECINAHYGNVVLLTEPELSPSKIHLALRRRQKLFLPYYPARYTYQHQQLLTRLLPHFHINLMPVILANQLDPRQYQQALRDTKCHDWILNNLLATVAPTLLEEGFWLLIHTPQKPVNKPTNSVFGLHIYTDIQQKITSFTYAI